jgi:hypothetical protein
MGGEEQLEYGPAARLRVTLAALLAGISDCARDGVPAYPDRDADPGALAQMAARIEADARQLMILAVACERSRGASWEAIAGALGLGVDGQAARDLYLPALTELDQAVVESWILGDAPRFAGIPRDVSGTAAAARHLDAWVSGRRPGGELDAEAAADPDRLFPVSGHLTPLSLVEQSDLLAASGALISGRHWHGGPDDCHVRRLELGYARRSVELYERMLAERPADSGPGPGTLQQLLAGARARLAKLTAAADAPGGATPEEP